MRKVISKLYAYFNKESRMQALLQWLLVLLIVFGFFTKLMKKQFRLTEYLIYPSTVIKTVIFLVLILLLVVHRKRKHIAWLGVLTSIFALGMMADLLWDHSILYYERFLFLGKYIFAMLAFFAFRDFLPDSMTKAMIKMLKKIGLINAVLVVLGMVLQVEIFTTYPFTSRLGFDGMISLQGEATFFYTFLISVTYIEWTQKKEKLWMLLIFVICGILVGTKALWLFVFLLALSYVLFVQKNKILKGAAVIGMLSSLFLGDFIMKITVAVFPYAQALIDEHGLMAFITSTRNLLFYDAVDHISKQWSFVNYLFGGINYSEQRVEFEPVDIFLFFGSIGLILFIGWLFSLYKNTSFQFKILYSIILVVAFLSGSLFASVANALLFAICIPYLKQITNPNGDHSTDKTS